MAFSYFQILDFCILSNSNIFSIHHATKKGEINSFCRFSRPNYGYNLTEVSKLPNFIDTSRHPEELPFLKMTVFLPWESPLVSFFFMWQDVMAIDTALQLLYVSARDACL